MKNIRLLFMVLFLLLLGTTVVFAEDEIVGEGLYYSYDYHGEEMSPVDFGGNGPGIAIKVSEVNQVKTKEMVIIELVYESEKDLNLTVFSPPDGDIFFYRFDDAIVEGNEKIYIYVPVDEIAMTDYITFGFFDDKGSTDFVYFETTDEGDEEDQWESLTIVESSEVQAVDFSEVIPFRIFDSIDSFGALALSRGVMDDHYVYKLDYESNDRRSMSFFTPGDSDEFVMGARDIIQSGVNTVYFKVNKTTVDAVDEITMSFFNSDDDRTFIYYNDEMVEAANLYGAVTLVAEAGVEDYNYDVDILVNPRSDESGMELKGLSVAQEDDQCYLRLSYTSDEVRNMSFWAWGYEGKEILSFEYHQVIEAGEGEIYLTLPSTLLGLIDEGVFLFNEDDSEGYSVNFHTSRLAIREVAQSEVNELEFLDDLTYIPSSPSEEFEVHSFKRAVDGDRYIFELVYTSNETRSMHFFDSPNNELFIFSLIDGIAPGTNTLYYEVPTRLLDQALKVTIGFSDDEDRMPFIMYDLHPGHFAIDMLDEINLPDIDFEHIITPTSAEYNGVEVKALNVSNYEGYYYFKMEYESSFTSKMSLFYPPDEDLFLGETGFVIEEGSHTIYFKVKEGTMNHFDEFAISFWQIYMSIADNPEPNVLYFTMDDVSESESDYCVNLHVSETQNFIVATWNNNNSNHGVVGYNLYRWENDDEDSMIRVTDSMLTDNKYFDSEVSVNTSYHYICKAVFSDGTESVASNEGVINVTLTNNRFKYCGDQDQLLLQIGNETFYNNGEMLDVDSQSDAKPYIKNSRTMIPIRAITESIGGEIGWDSETKMVSVNYNGNQVSIYTSEGTAVVNGESIEMENSPEIINGRTYLPIRFVLESLDLEVNWDGETKMIQILY